MPTKAIVVNELGKCVVQKERADRISVLLLSSRYYVCWLIVLPKRECLCWKSKDPTQAQPAGQIRRSSNTTHSGSITSTIPPSALDKLQAIAPQEHVHTAQASEVGSMTLALQKPPSDLLHGEL